MIPDYKFNIEQEKRNKDLVAISIENAKAKSDAKAYEISASMKAFDNINPNIIQSLANMGMKPEQLIAMAFQYIAENANKIGQLNVSPDLMKQLIK